MCFKIILHNKYEYEYEYKSLYKDKLIKIIIDLNNFSIEGISIGM